MGKQYYSSTNFTAGKLGHRLRYNVALEQYREGLEELKNRISLPQGGTISRPGLEFIKAAKNAGDTVSLIPWVYSKSLAYVIEAGDLYFRFFSSNGFLSGSEISTPYTQDDVNGIRQAQVGFNMFLAHGAYPVMILKRVSNSNWPLSEAGLIDGPYQTLQEGTISLSGPSATVQCTASSAVFAETDTKGTGTGSGTGLYDRHIRIKDGSTWRWAKIKGWTSTTVVEIEIQPDLDGNPVTLTGTGPFSFKLGAFSSTTGFPRTVTYFDNRLVFGGTDSQPDTVWASKIDDFLLFAEGTDADDPKTFVPSYKEVNEIVWMQPHTTLRVGTSGTLHSVEFNSETGTPSYKPQPAEGAGDVDAISVGDATVYWDRLRKRFIDTSYSFEQDSLKAADLSTVYTEVAGHSKALRSAMQNFPYNVIWNVFEDGSLKGLTYMRQNNVVAWHDHEVGGTDVKVKSVTCIPGPDRDEAWFAVERTVNGSTVTYIERMDGDFYGRSKYDMHFHDSYVVNVPETPSATLTPSAVTGNSVTFTAGASVFSASDVDRFIRYGTAKALIIGYTSGTVVTCRILSDFPSTSAIASGDWNLSTDTLTGMAHLEGETVSIVADGGVLADQQVVGGEVQLDGQYTYISAGLPYFQLQQSFALSPDPNMAYWRARVTILRLSVFYSVGGSLGSKQGNMRTLEYRVSSDILGEGVPPFTGEKEISGIHPFAEKAVVRIEQNQPLPLNINGWTAVVEYGDAA